MSNGKGDKQRPTDLIKYRNNYDEIFKEKKMDFHVATKGSKKDEKPIVLVDIDETICFYSGDRRYDLAEPSQENIAKINKMYDEVSKLHEKSWGEILRVFRYGNSYSKPSSIQR